MAALLEHAASVAGLVGVNAGGLISAILNAAVTARRNRRECDQLARRVLIIAELLPHLQGPEVIRRPLAGLEDALREAHDLVISCQGQSAAYRFVMAGRQAQRFRDVHARMDLYISVFPLLSHIAITRRLDRIQLSNNYITTSVRPVPDEVRHGVEEYLRTFAAAAAATNNHGDGAAGGATSTVAVRRLFASWWAEMEKRLLSFRRRKEVDGMLVCQYVNHGTLRDHLQHRPSSSSSPVTTSWKMRVEVLLRTSRAIEQHLHCSAVMHGRHVSSSTIILDASWRPRVSDRVDAGGMNINSPPTATMTSDIMHNFGLVMLEVLTGSPPSDVDVAARTSGEPVVSLVAFALPFVEAGQLAQVLDRRPTPEPTPRQLLALEQVAQTAARCLRLRAEDRPPILDVVANLERALNLMLPISILLSRRRRCTTKEHKGPEN